MIVPPNANIRKRQLSQAKRAQKLITATFTQEELQTVVDTSRAIEKKATGFWRVRIDLGYMNGTRRPSDMPMLVATLANALLPKSAEYLTVCWIPIVHFKLGGPGDDYEFGLPGAKNLKLMA